MQALLTRVHRFRHSDPSPSSSGRCASVLSLAKRLPDLETVWDALRQLPIKIKAECMLALLKHMPATAPVGTRSMTNAEFFSTLRSCFWENPVVDLSCGKDEALGEALDESLVRDALGAVQALCESWTRASSGPFLALLQGLTETVAVVEWVNREAIVLMVLRGLLEVAAAPCLNDVIRLCCIRMTSWFPGGTRDAWHHFCDVVWESWSRSRRPQCRALLQEFVPGLRPRAPLYYHLWMDALQYRLYNRLGPLLEDDQYSWSTIPFAVPTVICKDDVEAAWEVVLWLRSRNFHHFYKGTHGLIKHVEDSMERWLGLRSAWVAAVVTPCF